jgi:DNA-binding transcriptional ArsR family regulator
VIDAVFGALADPTRRSLYQQLLAAGPASASALAPQFPITRQGLTKHLVVLGDAGLVRGDRAGREVRYTARTEPLVEAAEWLLTTGAAWDRRLGRLQALLDPPERPAGGQ